MRYFFSSVLYFINGVYRETVDQCVAKFNSEASIKSLCKHLWSAHVPNGGIFKNQNYFYENIFFI